MLLVPPLACLPPHPVDRSGPSWCVLDSTHPETLLKTARIQSRTHRYPSTHARRGPSNRNPFHPPAGIMTVDDGGSCASGGRDGTAATAAALTAADDLPPPMTGQALDEHAARAWQFYRETLGSPKHVCAPMVRVCVCVWMQETRSHQISSQALDPSHRAKTPRTDGPTPPHTGGPVGAPLPPPLPALRDAPLLHAHGPRALLPRGETREPQRDVLLQHHAGG